MVGIFCIVTGINTTIVYTGPDGTMMVKSSAASKAEIAFMFIFGFVMSCGYTPLQALYPVEVLRYESRAKGMGFYNFWVKVASFYNTVVTGIAFAGTGWKYYFLFIFWDLFELRSSISCSLKPKIVHSRSLRRSRLLQIKRGMLFMKLLRINIWRCKCPSRFLG